MSRRFTIGRDRKSDIPIADESVSRQHAEIWLADDGSLRMADRGSSNGTSILRNGKSISLGEEVLQPGDVIRFGGIVLPVPEIVEAVEAKEPGALTPPPPQSMFTGAGPPPLPRAGSPEAILVACPCGATKTAGYACLRCGQ